MVKKGTKAKAVHNSLQPVVATARQDEDQLFVQLGSLPADPEDARLTLAGAVCGKDGKLDVGAYEDLQSAFAGEPPPARHPDPERPGTHPGEEVPKGLRIWDDLRAGATKKDGAGWIASSTHKGEKKKEKWFNIRTTGSWRLSFLLARLQRQLWEAGGCRQQASGQAPASSAPPASSAAPPAAVAAATAAAGRDEQAAADGSDTTPTRKRPSQTVPMAKATARKQARRAAEAAKTQPAVPDAFVGSERFAAFMAARKAQAEALAGQPSAASQPTEWV